MSTMCKLSTAFCMMILCLSGTLCIGDDGNNSKIFSSFSLGRSRRAVANSEECTDDKGVTGTCYTYDSKCVYDGGRISGQGSCPKSLGRCCIMEQTCGASTSRNRTHFVNPGSPAKDNNRCTQTIYPSDDAVQLRLEMLEMTLAPPDENGNCNNDFFIVYGGGSNVPVLCGKNDGQHVYVDFNGKSPITITIDIDTTLVLARSWRIRAVQIKSADRARAGCLQEYSATSGRVRSFNYDTEQSTKKGIPGPGTRELANLDYGVCIKVATGYCKIRWGQDPSDDYSFTVSGDTTTAAGLPDSSSQECESDYVIIPNPTQDGVALKSDRFCGNYLPTVTSSTKPFLLTIRTDNSEETEQPPHVGNCGINIPYRQLPCTVSRQKPTEEKELL